MVFGSQRRELAAKIAPAVESVGNAATAVIGLTAVSLIIATVALVLALRAHRSVTNG